METEVNKRLVLIILGSIFAICTLIAGEPEKKEPFIVTTEEYSKAPLSPILYGNFIELGYGIQVEAMYSEMLFNRSFERFLPYRDINKIWYDLYYDENDFDKGYEKDWSVFDWYHSGYEHNSWYAAPGDPGKGSVIYDEETFFHETTPLIIKEYDPSMKEDFQVQAAWDKDRQRVVLYVCNRTGDKRSAVFDLNALGRTFSTCSQTRLHADNPLAMNTFTNQDAIKVTKASGKARLKKGLYQVEAPAWSFTELILE